MKLKEIRSSNGFRIDGNVGIYAYANANRPSGFHVSTYLTDAIEAFGEYEIISISARLDTVVIEVQMVVPGHDDCPF